MAVLEITDLQLEINKQTLVRKASLMINESEFVFLLGKVGSGKTSLFRSIIADLDFREGEIRAVGYRLSEIKKSKIPFLRRKIGVVFQDFQLLDDRSVFENLKFVLKATGWTDKQLISNKVNTILESIGIMHLANKVPHELSGGEKQKTAIARALLNDPELILADEPTGNLDEDAALEIMNIFMDVKQSGTAILLATHNTSLADKYADSIYKIEEKKLYQIK